MIIVNPVPRVPVRLSVPLDQISRSNNCQCVEHYTCGV